MQTLIPLNRTNTLKKFVGGRSRIEELSDKLRNCNFAEQYGRNNFFYKIDFLLKIDIFLK